MHENGARSPQAVRRRCGSGESCPLAWRKIPQAGPVTCRSATILVVDDEQLIRWSLDDRLRSEGYRVVEARRGRDALDRVREGVDLVLLDYRLPDGDGLTVLKQIKEHDPDTLVILLTAYVERRHGRRGDEARAPITTRTSRSTSTKSSLLVEKALETTRLRREVRTLRASQAQPYSLDRIVGESRAIVGAAKALLQKVALEPGVDGAADGRERHRQGPRGEGAALQQRPRVAAVHEHHLLGAARDAARERAVRPRARRVHRRATSRSAGCSRRPTAARCSSTRSARWRRRCRRSCCGSSRRRRSSASAASRDIHVDVRVIAATNRNLEDEVQERAVPRGPLLPAQRAADRAAAAARARRRHSRCSSTSTSTPSTREFRKRVRGVAPTAMQRLQALRLARQHPRAAQRRRARDAAGRRRRARRRRTSRSRRAAPTAHRRRRAAGRPGSISSSSSASLVVQALERSGWNQTQRRRAARPEPRSDPLSHREVQPESGPVTPRGGRPSIAGPRRGAAASRSSASSCSATPWIRRRSSPSRINRAASPTPTTSSARSPATRATSCSARTIASSTPAITRNLHADAVAHDRAGAGVARRDPQPREGRHFLLGGHDDRAVRSTRGASRDSTSRSATTSRRARPPRRRLREQAALRKARGARGGRRARGPQSAGRHPGIAAGHRRRPREGRR